MDSGIFLKGKETEKKLESIEALKVLYISSKLWQTQPVLGLLRNEKVNLTFPFEDSKQP